LAHLTSLYGAAVSAEDLFAYVVGIAAHPGYTERFQSDLSTPGLRIPLTADTQLFREVAEIGRRVIWLHTFGERMADANRGRPLGPPRLPANRRPRVPAAGAIPSDPAGMPDRIEYDPVAQRLIIGAGWIEPVPAGVWNYEVSGKRVLVQWFSYRRKTRERPIIGDRRPPSPLGDIQPDAWPASYTSELLNVLNVLGLLIEIEPIQAELLDRVCTAALVSGDDLRTSGALFDSAHGAPRQTTDHFQHGLFAHSENLGIAGRD
jgi:hypothetical protein